MSLGADEVSLGAEVSPGGDDVSTGHMMICHRELMMSLGTDGVTETW